MWRLTYGFPIVIAAVQSMLMIFVFKWEPLDYLLKTGQNEKALLFLSVVYSPVSDDGFEYYVQ